MPIRTGARQSPPANLWNADAAEPGADVPEPRPAGEPYDATRHTNTVRARFVTGLVTLVAIEVLVPLALMAAGWATWTELEGFMTLTWGALIGLVGSAVGFYFASERTP